MTASRSATCYALIVISLFAFILYIGPYTQRSFSHDTLGLLEGGWKISQGHTPYVDFHTLTGPMFFVTIAGGIAIMGPVEWAFPVSIAYTLLIFAALCWFLTSERSSPWARVLLCSYLAMVWCGSYPLHFEIWDHSYAMLYNRQSYALLCVLYISFYTDPLRWPFGKGLILALLLFYKVPYFVAGVAIVGYYFIFSRPDLKTLLHMAAGFLFVSVPMLIFIGGPASLLTMAGYMREAAANRTPDVYAQMLNLAWLELPAALVLVPGLALSAWYASSRMLHVPLLPTSPGEKIRILTEPLLLLGIAFIAEGGSSPLAIYMEIPILCVYAVLVIDRLFAPCTRDQVRKQLIPAFLAICIAFTIFAPPFIRSVSALVSLPLLNLVPILNDPGIVILAPGTSRIRIIDRCDPYPPGKTYPNKVNDGIELIKKHRNLDKAVIATLDFCDSFSFPMQRKSPRHMPVGIQYGFNVSDHSAPDPALIFRDCDAIMIPIYPEDDTQTVELLRKRYKDYLSANFEKLDESPFWIVLIRKPHRDG